MMFLTEVITSRTDGRDPYGVTFNTRTEAGRYATVMRRAGYKAEVSPEFPVHTAETALADAGSYYDDPALTGPA